LKAADLRNDSWLQLVLAIQRGEHPDHDLLAAALRRGESVPPEAQAYLARIIEKARSLAPGRPLGSKSKKRSMLFEDLLLYERDVLMARLEDEGVRKAAQVADEQLGKTHGLGLDTLRADLSSAARREDWANAGLALRIDECRDLLARDRVKDPLRTAMREAADELGESRGVIKQRYKRGKAFIRRRRDDPSGI
jgi:hypothetical protein